MPRMLTFRLNRDCREVAVNAEKVLYVCQYEHGASCIHFGKDCHVRVQGDMVEITARIDAALCNGTIDAGTAPEAPTEGLRAPGVN